MLVRWWNAFDSICTYIRPIMVLANRLPSVGSLPSADIGEGDAHAGVIVEPGAVGCPHAHVVGNTGLEVERLRPQCKEPCLAVLPFAPAGKTMPPSPTRPKRGCVIRVRVRVRVRVSSGLISARFAFEVVLMV
jgi:hypothetical protein